MLWQRLAEPDRPTIIPPAPLRTKPFELDFTMFVKVYGLQIRETNVPYDARLQECACRLEEIDLGDIKANGVIVKTVHLLYLQISRLSRHGKLFETWIVGPT